MIVYFTKKIDRTLFRIFNHERVRPHCRDYLEVFPEMEIGLLYEMDNEFPTYAVKFSSKEQMERLLATERLLSPWSYCRGLGIMDELDFHTVKEGFGCVLWRAIVRKSKNIKDSLQK